MMETHNGFPKTGGERSVAPSEASLRTPPAQSYQGPELHEIGSLEQIQGLFTDRNLDRINGYRS